MEKEKEDETSPRGVLEAESEQQASESNASGSSSSSRARSRWGKIFKLWKIRPTKNHLPSLHTLSFSKLRWKSKSTKEDTTTTLHTGFYNFRSSLITFSLSELQYATNNFSSG
ncbi:Receptor-like cytosolic serine/threonine-protein kinase [Arachis hypogaea]|nr:Receptor-like cytosolic serine/threonine-protein kinase [Arachis hypogaea]